ncbi:flavodoxin [Sphingobium scionense]|uniref:Flavodoxin n=1 Tax=Sphingobium scionense TaxID=1404341 RepID=A0A7W6LUL3_9SPHN|nr:flavodoxin [Sphingobium scionense]MBB4150038.1 flavodoxin [Sphingobium scionense]
MRDVPDLSRRMVLGASAMLAFSNTAACAQDGDTARIRGGKILVAYLTRSGNTRVIAQTLHRALNADLFEIRPASPYPADYEEHVAQASRERAEGYAPPLAALVTDIASYDEVFLGFPIWGQAAPPPILSFLKGHDLRAKALRPFITHGGYGVGSAPGTLAGLAPAARIQPAFVMEADQERRTLNQIKAWLGRIEGE